MKVGVVGIGYVGLVTAACLADTGNDVRAIDNNVEKVAALAAGRCPIFEPGPMLEPSPIRVPSPTVTWGPIATPRPTRAPGSITAFG